MGSDTIFPESNDLERIQAELEATFCPPLDPALIAALVSELDPSPGSDALESLRLSLGDLATEASIANALNEDKRLSAFDKLSIKDDSTVSGSQASGSLLRDAAEWTPGTSAASSDGASFNTPLGFLRAVFPHLPVSTLTHTIDAVHDSHYSSPQATTLDMGLLVESLLSEEFLREEQERASSAESSDGGVKPTPEADWSLVEKKINRKLPAATQDPSSSLPASPKPRKAKASTVPLVDLLQRQHLPARRPAIDFDIAPDPWSHLASLASSLGQLLPDIPEGKWLALFHNPAYPTPSHAVRAELQRLSLLRNEAPSPETLNFLLEIIAATELEDSASRTKHDAELCLRACGNDAENALDLFRLLEEMDMAGAAVVHSVPSRTSTPNVTTSVSARLSPLLPPSRSYRESPVTSAPPSPPPITEPKRSSTHPQYQWQTVAPRKPAVPVQHPLSANIPAYRTVEPQIGKKKGRPTPTFRKEIEITPAPSVPAGLSELERCRWWMKELRRQRDEAVRAAGRHWRAGTAQDRGGEIAVYYADQSRNLEEQRRDWALKAARLQVQQQQLRSKDLHTIDLHGLTLHEALHVVKEGVNAWYSSSGSGYAPNHSLTIITGLGKHSPNQQGVLGPAIFKALEKDGWRVTKRPAAVVVIGVARG
ncbi:hypothetical protein CALVIDRAFT_532323 [Calocera viscosa TUFC12733]|uniref:Smr domain-containing protein n=1 Tax=Calocera viscosa (strain TUFC12733) TaxID=1330018 RepID=A0A167S3P8_CALVF|nr:hypothetical protein CALVIDRAFT_532323 [Calocera viscosa TUFC12733]